MKVRVDSHALSAAVATVRRLVDKRDPLPILHCIRLSADEKGLYVQGGQYSAWAKVHVHAYSSAVEENGECVVLCETLFRLLDKMADTSLALKIPESGKDLEITAQGLHINLPTIDVSEWPVFDREGQQISARISLSILREALGNTAFCAAPEDETRYVLTGAMLEYHGGIFRMDCTDGRRLAHWTTDVGKDAGNGDFRAVIPARALLKFLQMTSRKNGDTEVTIYTSGGFTIAVPGMAVTIREIEEGKFPDINSIAPRRFIRSVTINRQHLLSVAQRAVSVVDKECPHIGLRLARRHLNVNAMSESGTFEAAVHLETPGGTSVVDLSCNSRYLLSFLRATKAETLRIRFQEDPLSLFVLVPSDSNVTWMLMPVRVRDPIPIAEDGLPKFGLPQDVPGRGDRWVTTPGGYDSRGPHNATIKEGAVVQS